MFLALVSPFKLFVISNLCEYTSVMDKIYIQIQQVVKKFDMRIQAFDTQNVCFQPVKIPDLKNYQNAKVRYHKNIIFTKYLKKTITQRNIAEKLKDKLKISFAITSLSNLITTFRRIMETLHWWHCVNTPIHYARKLFSSKKA